MKKKALAFFLGGFALCGLTVAATWGLIVFVVHKESLERRLPDERRI